jgi:hypothetical protein
MIFFRNVKSLMALACFVVGSLLVPELLFAQKYPLELSTSQTGLADLDGQTGAMSVQVEHASIILPVLPFEAVTLLFYLKEDRKKFTFDESVTEFTLAETDQTILTEEMPEKLALSTRGLLLFFNSGDSRWMIRRDETIASDWEDVDGNDHSFSNQLMYTPNRKDKSRWSYGLTQIGGISSDLIVPLLGYKYLTDDLIFDMVLPSYGYMFARLSDFFYVMFEGSVESDSYRLTEDAPWNNSVMSFLNLTTRMELGINPFSGLEIGLSYGVNVYRKIFIYDEDLEETGNLNLKDTAIWGVNIQWRL